jgi:hypothetical protein
VQHTYVGVASVGMFFGIVGLVCAVIHLSRQMFNENGYIAQDRIVLFRPDFDSICIGIREMIAAIFAHPFLPFIANEMYIPSRNRVMKVTWIATAASAMFVYVTPAIGYLQMTDVGRDSNFFLELDGPGSYEVIVGEICVLILSITSNLIFTYFVSRSVMMFFHDEQIGSSNVRSSSPISRMFVAVPFAMLAISVNSTNEVVEYVVYEIAMVGYCFIGFVLPALYYLIEFHFRVFKWGVASSLLLCIGIGLMIVMISNMAKSLHSGDLA